MAKEYRKRLTLIILFMAGHLVHLADSYNFAVKEGLCLCTKLPLDPLVKGKTLSAHSVSTCDGFVSGHDDGSGVVTHADGIHYEVC